MVPDYQANYLSWFKYQIGRGWWWSSRCKM